MVERGFENHGGVDGVRREAFSTMKEKLMVWKLKPHWGTTNFLRPKKKYASIIDIPFSNGDMTAYISDGGGVHSKCSGLCFVSSHFHSVQCSSSSK